MKKHLNAALNVLLIGGLFVLNLSAQSLTSFQSLVYPRSLSASGLGEQGVASRDPLDAMQYNPANLIYAKGINFSYFRNPWNIIWVSLPISTVSCIVNLGSVGKIGLEYTDWDFGDVTYTTINMIDLEVIHVYERSFAGTYATSLGENLALGAQVRYIWQPYYPNKIIDQLLFSAGISYRPESCSDRLTIGLSFINFGNKIQYESGEHTINGNVVRYSSESPAPAQINFGLNILAVANNYFDLSLSLSTKKPLDKMSGYPNYSAQSSFTSLFNDWDDFPEDMTIQTGLGFIWHPIYLGSGISYVQEMYLGYFSTGPKDLYNSFYTHGLRVGLETQKIKATIGYAGRWHNNNSSSYITWRLPWETFQIHLNAHLDLFGKQEESAQEEKLHDVFLTGGCSFGSVIGKMKEVTINNVKRSFSTSNIWSVGADFYLNDKSAIVASFDYSRLTETYEISSHNIPYWPSTYILKSGIETFSLESGFRYHLLDIFSPLYIQASLGIIRMNPVIELTSPRYYYNSFTRLVVGCMFSIANANIILAPKAGLKTIFMKEFTNSERLGGYNMFEFGISAGIRM